MNRRIYPHGTSLHNNDKQKSILEAQSNRQLELELTKLRQCIEEKAALHEKSNDLNWEIEKFKRSNNDLTADNHKLNDKVTEYASKYENALQEIQTLKVEIMQLNEKHDNIQDAMHQHIGRNDGPQIIEKQPMITEPHRLNTINPNKQHQLIDSPFARNKVSIKSAKIGIAVVIFCYNRHSYLERTLDSLFAILPPTGFSVFISQDGMRCLTFCNINFYYFLCMVTMVIGYDAGVTEVIKRYSDEGKAYWLGFDYDATDKQIKRGFEEKRWSVYHKISAHYKFAFNYLFDELNYDKVISLEDDMELSPDFFGYFQALGKCMDMDPSIFCVSAWNDNGQKDLVYDSKSLYRTDIFPGLGWMLGKKIWNELKDNWPLAFWDDWLRESKQRKNRSCIRPEINRVYTFGSTGSSEGQFFKQYLKKIKLNEDDIDWTSDEMQNGVVSYISPVDEYDAYLKNLIESSRELDIENVLALTAQPMPLDYVVRYSDLDDFTLKSKQLQLMEDHKDNLPRQSYRGIVDVRWKNNRISFVPKDVDWSPRTYG